jgi:prepilin-type N-terminal cleavage/methylation domain-containing protein
MHKQQGYTLLELLIVIVVIAIVACAVTINLRGALANVNVDYVALEIASKINDAQLEAIKGNDNASSRQFDLQTALPAKRNGITVSNQTPSAGVSQNCGEQNSETLRNKCSGSQYMCVEGIPFCYRSSSRFSFEQYTGKLSYEEAIFVSSRGRNLAVLVNTEGRIVVAELNRVTHEWRYRN